MVLESASSDHVTGVHRLPCLAQHKDITGAGARPRRQPLPHPLRQRHPLGALWLVAWLPRHWPVLRASWKHLLLQVSSDTCPLGAQLTEVLADLAFSMSAGLEVGDPRHPPWGSPQKPPHPLVSQVLVGTGVDEHERPPVRHLPATALEA